jgi:hypothetical protein
MNNAGVIAAIVLLSSTLTIGSATAARSATFPGVQPQLAALGPRVYVTYGADNTIGVARSDDGGDTFQSPVRLPVSGRMSLGMHRGPRVAATTSAVLVTAVIGTKGGGADGDVLLYRSGDRGTSWGVPTVINDVPGSAREGLHAMAANAAGLVVVAWLDLRDKGTRIYAAISRDHGATWVPDVLVYASPSGSVCECCHPSIAIDAQGTVAVMFRNSVDGNRDMYVARSGSDGRFASAAKVGTESWLLNACPMDGGGIGFGTNGLVAAWRRDTSVYLTTPQAPERRLGPGRDPAIATAGTHVDLAWSAPEGLQLVRDSGKPVSLGPGRFPALLAFPDRTILAFENQGSVEVRAIRR